MKKYVTIKLEKEDLEHLKEWIRNVIKIAPNIRPDYDAVEWQKKLLEKIEKQEPTSK